MFYELVFGRVIGPVNIGKVYHLKAAADNCLVHKPCHPQLGRNVSLDYEFKNELYFAMYGIHTKNFASVPVWTKTSDVIAEEQTKAMHKHIQLLDSSIIVLNI